MPDEQPKDSTPVERGEDTPSKNHEHEPAQQVPYDRFKQVNDEKKAAQQQAEDMRARIEEIERKQMEEKEEFKDLYETTKSKYEEAKAKAAEWDTYQATRRETLISQLPEDHQDIAEGISDLTKLEQYVRINTQESHEPREQRTKAGRVGQTFKNLGIENPADAAYAYRDGKITEQEYKEYRKQYGK